MPPKLGGMPGMEIEYITVLQKGREFQTKAYYIYIRSTPPTQDSQSQMKVYSRDFPSKNGS